MIIFACDCGRSPMSSVPEKCPACGRSRQPVIPDYAPGVDVAFHDSAADMAPLWLNRAMLVMVLIGSALCLYAAVALLDTKAHAACAERLSADTCHHMIDR